MSKLVREVFKLDEPDPCHEVHVVEIPHLFGAFGGVVPIVKGEFKYLPKKVQTYLCGCIELCKPRGVYICDGGELEAKEIIEKLEERGTLHKLKKYKNNYICRTDPADVARVESKTVICTKDKYQTVPHVAEGATGILGHHVPPDEMKDMLMERLPGCMAGRLMYVIPFSMGPIGSPLSKIGVQITDSNYVVLCMRIMARVSPKVWQVLGDNEFVKCFHSVGSPRPNQRKVINHWPCNPEKVLISHFPDEWKVISYGSGYGGNSLLGKKCFALRIASCIARDEGWMAEHMLIMGVTNPQGEEKFIAAAFPSACGKTNMAMLEPTLPGWKVRVVGDDIAWMKFGEDGRLYGINPESGFFGVAPGTNYKTNPNAMRSFECNSIFTNIAETDDGSYYWEGLEDETDKDMGITSWLGERFKIGQAGKAAHPNSRFTAPASQCPTIHPKWEDPQGVPIEALIFGGRRPEGVPLVVEAFDWTHGVMLGAALKSETTAAAEFKGKTIMHDPMAMRPFIGYNFGHYVQHWLDLEKPERKMPKIFHVNWFRVDKDGKFLWPGFGDNIRVIDWVMQRCNGVDNCEPSAVGNLPRKGSINMAGLNVDEEELFSLPKEYWKKDVKETRKFFQEQVGCDMPDIIYQAVDEQEKRIENLASDKIEQEQMTC